MILAGHQSVAIAPDGNWVATCNDDRTIRILNTATWQVQALMRVDDAVGICAWINNKGIAVASPAGLYVFDFLDGDTVGIPQLGADPGASPVM
jgi:WD40 repeat protein